MLQILLSVIVANSLVNVLIAILIILVVGGLAFYALGKSTMTPETKNWFYAGIAVVLIIIFLYLIGIV